ncbi:PUR family DNA/RNA-binding protein [Phocaeicola salanitronis]|uniref:PUR family DNA/RNA-binding protein n=1 Tax=Phocaeicola salanitronis TaxID=376805 RepID=UPI0023F754E1|nr:PUR family DNA/RNA-binding protein [Phocaeicola salanitronis]
MEEFKKNMTASEGDKEIVFTKAVKAGKRIYYLDVKKSRKGEMFLAITESKKITTGEGEASQVSFEKHKIFLYKEDFEKFLSGLQETIQYIEHEQGPIAGESHMAKNENLAADEILREPLKTDDIKIDIDF